MIDTLGTAEVGAWKNGVNTATDPTLLPGTASPRGRNCALAFADTGIPYVQKRLGLATINATAVAVSPAAITSQFFFSPAAVTTPIVQPDGSVTIPTPDPDLKDRHLFTIGNKIGVMLADWTHTLLSPTVTFATRPAWAAINNAAYLATGATTHYRVSALGAIRPWGIRRPPIGTTAGAAGAAGLHNGTYELRVTFYNADTESSASETAAATVTVTNEAIDWSNLPISSEAHVVGRHLYVRNVATQTQFYRVGTVTNNTSTSASTSVLDANALTVAPTTTERNPPPAGIAFVAVYRGRIFMAGADVLYWAKLDGPEAISATAFSRIGSEGDAITGLIADEHDRLLITTADKTYALIGEVDDDYTIRLLHGQIGCLTHHTMVNAGGFTYWWGRQGLIRVAADSSVEAIGLQLYGDPTRKVHIAQVAATASAIVHTTRQTVYLALPETEATRATFLLPYNYANNVLESDQWDPIDIASLGVSRFSSTDRVILGGYGGQFFGLWETTADGIASGTTSSGTFVAAAHTVSTITDTGATFDTTGAGLLERKVTVVDANGVPVSAVRPRITSNTGTTITFTPTLVGLTIGDTYTYVVGGPLFEFDTPWRTFSDPWSRKRFEWLQVLSKGAQVSGSTFIAMAFDYDENFGGAQVTMPPIQPPGGVWDSALWDVSVWDGTDNIHDPRRIARVGRAYKVRFRNIYAGQPFALLALSVQAVRQGRRTA